MLTEQQIQEIREHLNKSQNPLFFFDNDADGLSSFLLLKRYINRGKGVAIKSFPDLNVSYARKIHELKPDYIFVLDKPEIDEGFIKEVFQLNLPFVWIDHHNINPKNLGNIYYFNPMKTRKAEDSSSEPVTYWCYKTTSKKEDIWIAMIGCIGDGFLPEFSREFSAIYPELWSKNIKTAFQALYETELGRITKILSFALKDRTSNVVRMLKSLSKMSSPHEIIKNEKNKILHRFNQVNIKYQRLLNKARNFVKSDKLVFFQYGGDLSLSADLANELSYNYSDKIIIVAYIKGTKANVSIRGKNVRELTLEAIKSLENATGGGHQDATGAQIQVEDIPKFRENLSILLNK